MAKLTDVSATPAKPARRKGIGGIRQRPDGRWEATISQGFKPGAEPGQPKRQRIYLYGKTEREVVRKQHDALERIRKGLPIPSERITVEEYLHDWMRTSSSSRLKASSFNQYASALKNHVIPTLGRLRLAKLEPKHLEELYTTMRADLAPATVLYTHRVIHRALAHAERQGAVVRNVAGLVDPPRVGRSEVKAFNIEQAQAFMRAVSGTDLEALYMIAITAGLRRGEILALRWGDIDFDRRVVAVQRNLMKVKGGWEISEPKTPSSRRSVQLTDIALASLEKRREALSVTPHPSAYVFSTGTGKHLDGRNVSRLFKQHLTTAGLPATFTFHSLRHSAATLMLAMGGMPKVVSETLGHSRIAITMDTYSHVLPHLQAELAAKMDVLFGAPGLTANLTANAATNGGQIGEAADAV